MRALCKLFIISAVFAGTIVAPASISLAAKKYQVTGTIVEIGDKVIVVEKRDGEKWEIDRTADTKVEGELIKGAKVTVHYTMSASDIEVKK